MRSDKKKNKKGLRSQKAEQTSIQVDENGAAIETTSKKKWKLNKKRFLLFILACILVVGIIGCAAVGYIISQAPEIKTDQIYEILTESTVIYDDKGKEIDTVYAESNRTNVKFEDLPDNLVNALVALEDKTFWTHNGFNFVRIGGAIMESVLHGGDIGGTSTLTQQLARNLFLTDSQYDYSYKRKIIEAYYSVILERELSKEQIIEAYCNTVFFGFGCHGVQSASQAYFSKDVSDLTLAQCAALVAIPQSPTNFALVELVGNDDVSENDKNILKRTSSGTYIANDTSKDRRETCLSLMLEQGYITQKQHDKAVKTKLKKMLDPSYTTANGEATYFQDYVIDEVIEDLMEEKDWSYDKAWNKVYQGGIKIYSTMDSQAQNVIEKEFAEDSNFPGVYLSYDDDGNLLNQYGQISLYDYDDYFNKNGTFTFKKSEIVKQKNGSLVIKYGKRLNIYETELGDGSTDYSIEFKPMYKYEDGTLYSISGGFVNIPQNYKSMNKKGNIVIAKEMFENEYYKDFFVFNDNGTVSIPSRSYSLEQEVVQPQAAMTIVENATGYIKAMVGGRETTGRQLHNRAISPQQPGSSIKPLGVYSAAIQQSAEEAEAGIKHNFIDYDIDQQGDDLWGYYLTPASIVVDEKTKIEGRIWPRNAGGGYSGVQTMRSAIQSSINTCAVKILLQVGAEYSADLVEKFGITTLDKEGDVNDINPAALALGGMSEGVTTLDMASAYTVFPNNGKRYETTAYTKVVDRDGEVLLNNSKTEAKRVLDAGVAWIMKDMLQSVVYGGTGGSAAISGVTVGGKTGTTDDEFDIWFDGFTPSYSASLWIGNDQNFELDSMSGPAASLWGEIMDQIDGAKEGSYKSMPSNVIHSGDYCISGTQGGVPSRKNLEKELKVCEDSGYLATPSCPDTEKEKFLNYGDAKKKIPKYYCNEHNPNPDKYKISSKETWSDEDAIAKKKAEEEAKKKAEEEAKKKAEEEAKKKAEEEAKKKAEQEAAAQAEQNTDTDVVEDTSADTEN